VVVEIVRARSSLRPAISTGTRSSGIDPSLSLVGRMTVIESYKLLLGVAPLRLRADALSRSRFVLLKNIGAEQRCSA
jgi:hypothetical protein